MSNKSYRPQLDGVRAFCIIFTVFHHIQNVPWFINGSVGVDVFFSLSGWLITWLLLQEKERNGYVNVGAFYIRRICRIMPMYYLTILIYAVLALAVAGHDPEKLESFRFAAPYLLTFNSEYRPPGGGPIFAHAWTLGIEEKFYLVWPMAVVFLPRHRAVTMIVLACLLTVVLSFAVSLEDLIRGYFGLGFGTVLALTVRRNQRLMDWLRVAAPAFPLFIALVTVYTLSVLYPVPLWWNLMISALSGLMIASIWFNQTQAVSTFLRLKPLPFLGSLTYVIYLLQALAINAALVLFRKFHIPEHWLLVFVASYALSILLGYAAHRLIEEPFIQLGRRLSRKATTTSSESAMAG
ncbi:acyltransferase family protein [Beijerinckia indica]|uniref:Acyltransferase 3 n=1 Tax=Beijerinckia indica subsp. indica (strain ATCC 9039 / DSM 1715 / NCIMB 8712) TaxID=395963 RepID=B2IG05_BEII9|nr:acyltransferase [Beijerinckia indica]ACB95744.1 acyltransferase 3 [Beijerinckia indica subsp. indica ATCC 9039]